MAKEGGETWTVLKLLDWTREYFAKSGLQDSRLCAEVLLAHALGCKRIELYAHFDRVPSQAQLDSFRDHVRRAAKHEPVAYLVGSKEFYSLNFTVTHDVLIPRPETEMLVTESLEYLAKLDNPRLWDVCTGSGCVGIAAAVQLKSLSVLATDISESAVSVAAENAAALGVQDRVRCRVADCLTLPEDCGDFAGVDVITANPPYVAKEDEVAESVKHEPEVALYAPKSGLVMIERIIQEAPRHLRIDGALIMEFGYGQADAVRDLFVGSQHFCEPTIYSDYQDLERMCVAIRSE
jgi:release factor glutamine methyltransferase